MRKQVMAGLLGLAAFVAVGVSTTNVAQAAATVKINGATVYKKYLNIDTYYKTNKATKAKIFYDKVSSGQSGYSKTVTLPKGTIVASDLGKNSKFYFYENRLNYGLVNKYAKKGYVVGAHSYGVSVSPSSFKKISTPSYLPTWSYGNLYLGGASAAKKFYEYPCESEC